MYVEQRTIRFTEADNFAYEFITGVPLTVIIFHVQIYETRFTKKKIQRTRPVFGRTRRDGYERAPSRYSESAIKMFEQYRERHRVISFLINSLVSPPKIRTNCQRVVENRM